MPLTKLYTRTPGLLEHSLRVFYFCQQVIKSLPENLITRQQERDMLAAAMYHDIGKSRWHSDWFVAPRYAISVTDWTIMEMHPIQAVGILQQAGIEISPGAARIIEQHHEQPGGKGYPHGIEPDFVSVIFAAVDVFSACTEARPYRDRPMMTEQALQEVARFAPDVVVRALRQAAQKMAA